MSHFIFKDSFSYRLLIYLKTPITLYFWDSGCNTLRTQFFVQKFRARECHKEKKVDTGLNPIA